MKRIQVYCSDKHHYFDVEDEKVMGIVESFYLGNIIEVTETNRYGLTKAYLNSDLIWNLTVGEVPTPTVYPGG